MCFAKQFLLGAKLSLIRFLGDVFTTNMLLLRHVQRRKNNRVLDAAVPPAHVVTPGRWSGARRIPVSLPATLAIARDLATSRHGRKIQSSIPCPETLAERHVIVTPRYHVNLPPGESSFRYSRVMRMACGTWAEPEVRFYGNVVSGRLSRSDRVSIPLIGGRIVIAQVIRFCEDFTEEWLGLPFYETVTPETSTDAFCVCVSGAAFGRLMIAPSACLSVVEA